MSAPEKSELRGSGPLHRPIKESVDTLRIITLSLCTEVKNNKQHKQLEVTKTIQPVGMGNQRVHTQVTQLKGRSPVHCDLGLITQPCLPEAFCQNRWRG